MLPHYIGYFLSPKWFCESLFLIIKAIACKVLITSISIIFDGCKQYHYNQIIAKIKFICTDTSKYSETYTSICIYSILLFIAFGDYKPRYDFTHLNTHNCWYLQKISIGFRSLCQDESLKQMLQYLLEIANQ